MSGSTRFTHQHQALAVALLLMLIPVLGCGGPTLPTLVPTAHPGLESTATSSNAPPADSFSAAEAPAAEAETLKAQMIEELRGYDYEQQQILVEDVETGSDELVVYIKRRGSPSMSDYFGQLGTIHAVLATNEPDTAAVRTIDVDARNGFVVDMKDLLDYYHGRIDFETYRARWRFFEP